VNTTKPIYECTNVVLSGAHNRDLWTRLLPQILLDD